MDGTDHFGDVDVRWGMLRVVDWRGLGVAHARVTVLERIDQRAVVVYRATSDNEGLLAIPDFPRNGKFDLSVRIPQGRVDLRSCALVPWLGDTDRVVLSRGFLLSGRIRPRRGAELPDYVVIRPVGHGLDVVEVGPTGEFSHPEVPWGAVAVAYACGEPGATPRINTIVVYPEDCPLQLET